MPEIVVHHFFAQRVYDQMPDQIVSKIDPGIYRIGARGPDPLGILRFWWLPFWRQEHRKSFVMHHEKSGAFFRSLTMTTRAQEGKTRDELFSFLCGFLTHYYLDASCHPYIIYRTGLGEGTSGNHRSLEHAMDRDVLTEHQMKLSDRSITRRVLPEHGLPDTMRNALNAVYQNTFGWPDMWKKINHALEDEKRFIRMMEDPGGFLYRLFSCMSGKGTLRSLSYAEKAYEKADIWNNGHAEWRNPYSPEIISNLSVKDLEETAFHRATETIPKLYDCIYGLTSYPGEIESRSYESGLDTEDPRNQNVPVYNPLPR